MIRKFLGQPDANRRNPWNPAGPGLCLFDAMRVDAIESTEAFTAAKAKRAKRAKAGRQAAETRRSNLRDRAASLVVKVQRLDPAALQERAISWHNGAQQRQARRRPGFTPLLVGDDSAPEVLASVMQRFATSALVELNDPDLVKAARRAGAGDVVDLINRQIRAAINAAYPHLNPTNRRRPRP